MAKHVVRRIAVEPHARTTSEWDNAWPSSVVAHVSEIASRIRERLLASSSILAYWGGLAAILGGILWAILFAAFQSQESGPMSDWFAVTIASWGYTKLFAIPLVLFLFCLVVVLIVQEQRSVVGLLLHRLGFALTSFGLISLIVVTLDDSWLYRLTNNPDLIGVFNVDDRWYGGNSLSEWVGATPLPLMFVCIGLTLFGIAAIRSRVLPIWSILWLVISSLALFLIPLGISIFMYGEDSYALLYENGFIVFIALTFGAGWAILGYALLRGRIIKYNQSPNDSSRSLA